MQRRPVKCSPVIYYVLLKSLFWSLKRLQHETSFFWFLWKNVMLKFKMYSRLLQVKYEISAKLYLYNFAWKKAPDTFKIWCTKKLKNNSNTPIFDIFFGDSYARKNGSGNCKIKTIFCVTLVEKYQTKAM